MATFMEKIMLLILNFLGGVYFTNSSMEKLVRHMDPSIITSLVIGIKSSSRSLGLSKLWIRIILSYFSHSCYKAYFSLQ